MDNLNRGGKPSPRLFQKWVIVRPEVVGDRGKGGRDSFHLNIHRKRQDEQLKHKMRQFRGRLGYPPGLCEDVC